MHGGYFEGLLSQELIYRLACLGYDGTVAAYGSEAALRHGCASKANSHAGVAGSEGTPDRPGGAASAG